MKPDGSLFFQRRAAKVALVAMLVVGLSAPSPMIAGAAAGVALALFLWLVQTEGAN